MDVAPDSPLSDPSQGPGEGAIGERSADARGERARTRRRRILRGAVIGGVVASVATYIGLLVMVGEATATPRRSESESPVGVASTTNNPAGMIAVGLAVVIVLTSTLVALRLVFSRHPSAGGEDTSDRTTLGRSVAGGPTLDEPLGATNEVVPPPDTRAPDARAARADAADVSGGEEPPIAPPTTVTPDRRRPRADVPAARR